MNAHDSSPPMKLPENWTPPEDVLRETLSLTNEGRQRDTVRYHWMLGIVGSAFALVLGMYIQSERFTKTIYTVDARVTVLEKRNESMEAKLDKIIDNMVTKDDLRARQ